MSRFLFGYGSRASSQLADEDRAAALDEAGQLDAALQAAELIMNDELETAEKNLENGTSTFHVLGQGIVSFLQAALGAEQDVMKQASERLNRAETVAAESQKRAQRTPASAQTAVFPPGTEYAVIQAQAQTLGALVCVMNETLTDAIRGFVKLRRAYSVLESVAAVEAKSLSERGIAGAEDALHGNISNARSVGDEQNKTESKAAADPTNTDSIALFDNPIDRWIQSAASSQFGMLLVLLSIIPPAFTRLLSIVGFRGDRDRGLGLLWRATTHENINGAVAGLVILGYCNSLTSFLDIKPPGSYPEARLKDLLNRMRQRYPQSELWRLEKARMASADKDFEAAVTILGPSTGPLGEPDETSPPAADDSAAAAAEKKPMKQVLALQLFERALNCMYLHAYELCASTFIRLVDTNTWSHALYYYIAGSAHIELYRTYKYGGVLPVFHAGAPTTFAAVAPDATRAARHATQARDYYAEVSARAGKRKLLARQLPFDVFTTRKLQKWAARAAAWGVDLVDAVGVSPLEEMIFFHSGHGRMPRAHLDVSLARLAWSDGDASLLEGNVIGIGPEEALPASNPHWGREALDEKAILAVLRATALRSMGRTYDARTLLKTEVVDSHSRAEFRAAKHGDNWTAPIARYELAANLWAERFQTAGVENGKDSNGTVKDETGALLNRAKLVECAKLLDEVARWEAYDLNVRVGIKVTTGKETLSKLGIDV